MKEIELAFQEKERLILMMVDMQAGAYTRLHDVFKDGLQAPRLVTQDPFRVMAPGKSRVSADE